MSDPSRNLPREIESMRFDAHGLDVHALAAGPVGGELVLLLHGFPELSRSWRHQLVALGEQGYRAVAPDQRGYGTTTRRGPYDIETLAADTAAMIDALGATSAIVVGHDWGGAVAWAVAALHPEHVSRLIVANCPPGQVMARAMRDPGQLKKSSYMFFFQLPVIPEKVLTSNNSARVAQSLVGGSYVKSAFVPEELVIYREAFSQPGAASAALNWYRAAMRSVGSLRRLNARRVSAPTHIIWGRQDRFIGSELVSAESLSDVMAEGNYASIDFIDGAGHFVQNEAPEQFNRLMLDWLARPI